MKKIDISEMQLLKEINQLALRINGAPVDDSHTEQHNRSLGLFSRAVGLTHDALWD